MVIASIVLFYILSLLVMIHDWRARGYSLTVSDLVVLMLMALFLGWLFAIKNLFKWLMYKMTASNIDRTILDWTDKKPWM